MMDGALTGPARTCGSQACRRVAAITLGLLVVLVAQGFSGQRAVRSVEHAALAVIVVAALIGSLAFVAVRMAGWRDPVSEQEFDRIVRRAERQAEQNLFVEPEEGEFMELDPLNDRDFDQLVREALEEYTGPLAHRPAPPRRSRSVFFRRVLLLCS